MPAVSPERGNRAVRAVGAAAAAAVGLYAGWLGMLAVHEFGHAAAAVATGARIERIEIPLWGFSRTDVVDPRAPALILWCGILVGALVPWAAALLVPRRARTRPVAEFFAGFCGIANGAYLAVGCWLPAGDAAELMRLGAPRAVLVLVGAVLIAIGLHFWHRLGPRFARLTGVSRVG